MNWRETVYRAKLTTCNWTKFSLCACMRTLKRIRPERNVELHFNWKLYFFFANLLNQLKNNVFSYKYKRRKAYVVPWSSIPTQTHSTNQENLDCISKSLFWSLLPLPLSPIFSELSYSCTVFTLHRKTNSVQLHRLHLQWIFTYFNVDILWLLTIVEVF